MRSGLLMRKATEMIPWLCSLTEMNDRCEARAGVGADDRVQAAAPDRDIGTERAYLAFKVIGDVGIVGIHDVDRILAVGVTMLAEEIDESVRGHFHAVLLREVVELAILIDLEERTDIERGTYDGGSGADSASAL